MFRPPFRRGVTRDARGARAGSHALATVRRRHVKRDTTVKITNTLTALKASAAVFAVGLGLSGTPGFAQEIAPSDEAAETDTIIVTGSRIARPDLESQSPIALLGRDFIQQDAATNVQDILNELPQVGIGTSRTNSNFLTGANGVATIDLRNLGEKRTLVLINGRRSVPGIAGSSAVDVNNIPTDLLERVDIVTGGQSAVYGSDAVAGVVNFIMRESFEGLSIRAQSGLTTRGDNPRYLVSITGGQSFGGGRGNIMANFSYDRDEGLLSRKRGISDQDCFYAASPEDCGPGSYSSYSAQGRFELLDADGNAQPGFNGGSLFSFDENNNLISGGGAGFNRNAVRRISVPVERYMGTVIGNYELTDGIKAYAEFTYTKVKSSSQIEATPLDYTDLYDDGGIPLTNAFIPQAVRDQVAAWNAAALADGDDDTNPITSIGFRRRQNEVFSRSNTAERDFYRGVVGVKGDISDRWQFDASYVYGRMKDFTASQDIDSARYVNALNSTVVNGQIVCADPAARADGCVPIDIFGYGTASPDASAYVLSTIPKSEKVTNTQHVISFNVSGRPFTLPAGDVGIAIGAEYRKDKSIDDLDELTNIGGNSGNEIPDIRGSVEAKEIYGEILVPVLRDTSFFQSLELTAAARYSDYKGKGVIAGQSVTADIGKVFSWNVGANWEVFRGVKLRAAYAEANRAPNVGELYQAPSETFPGESVDPCVGMTATTAPAGTTAAQAAACRALPGFGANLAQSPDGRFFYSLADIQGINGFDGGNVNLREETAQTFNVGAVFTPESIRGLSLSVDYFRIKVKNAIDVIPREFSIVNCLETGMAEFCDNVFRDQRNGRITRVDAQNLNVAGIKTEGIDFNLQYAGRLGLTPNDRFSANLYYTYLIALEKLPYAGGDVFDNRGLLDGEGRLGAGFKHKATGRFSYNTGKVTLSWQATYLGKIQDMRGGYPEEVYGPGVDRLNRVGAKLYNDAQLRYAIEEGRFEFYLGMDNIFDVRAPFLPSGFASDITGTETAADTYDPFGRRIYAGFQAKF